MNLAASASADGRHDSQGVSRVLLFEFMRTGGKPGSLNNTQIPADELYFAVERHVPDEEFIRNSVKSNPKALLTPRERGWLPLHHAAMANSFSSVELLLDLCPSAVQVPQEDGFLPLHMAVYFEEVDIEVVRLLLTAHPNAAASRSKDGRTPLHVAIQNSALDRAVIELLISANPSALTVATDSGSLPLHLCVLSKHCKPDVLDVILSANKAAALVRDGVPRSRLALHYCVINALSTPSNPQNSLEMVQILIGQLFL
jgi:hypothetical protein